MESYVKERTEVMKAITRVLKSKDIDFCFIGGAALPEYNYNRMTEDIDILVSKKDKEKFLSLTGTYLKRKFKDAEKSFYWNNPKTQIDVIYSGDKAGDKNKGIEYKEPHTISKIKDSLPTITLKNLIQYKLCSGMYGIARYKDFGDIVALIEVNKLSIDFADKFRDDLKEKYIQLWKEITNQ
jgi:hypothetical protein